MLRTILLSFGVLTVLLGSFMCYAEHHIKRILAFSTIAHAGLMLTAIATATGGPATLATAGFLIYLVGHAFVKSALFFVAGILLHRLRTASEPALFGQGRKLRFTAALWFLGGLGLAAFPGFATMNGEALTSNAAESSGIHWLSLVFMLAGTLTSAAVFRVGFHTFFGWGTEPISDESSRVDESPEDSGDDEKTFWYQILPPVLCVTAAVALAIVPHFTHQVLEAANRITFQPAYLDTVYGGNTPYVTLPTSLNLDSKASALRGCFASTLAVLLALTSVLRKRLPRILRLGALLEGPLVSLRALQSGMVGDYVLWLTIGTSVLAAAYIFLLR
jgi:multicomponent Na+:H+ antiporter subunit D